jgi:CDP-diacylglycerol---serine O-phosphatidyltransferase
MKHLPNLFTLGNLVCGCIAIAYTQTAMPYYIYKTTQYGTPTYEWVYGVQQMYFGGIFIFIAAVCDFLDGFFAKSLKIFSPIGKDLDSLADIVSFGVAPSFILFQLLWDAQMAEKNVFDVSMVGMMPAFLVACFAALRLAKFNISAANQKKYFIGMPVPAVGLLIASLPLIVWFNPFGGAGLVKSKWVLYALIALVCWLMVSKIRFIKFSLNLKQIKASLPTLIFLALAILVFLLFPALAIPVMFVIYIVLSMIFNVGADDQIVE